MRLEILQEHVPDFRYRSAKGRVTANAETTASQVDESLTKERVKKRNKRTLTY